MACRQPMKLMKKNICMFQERRAQMQVGNLYGLPHVSAFNNDDSLTTVAAKQLNQTQNAVLAADMVGKLFKTGSQIQAAAVSQLFGVGGKLDTVV
jgi:hypothetical protein